MIRIKNKFIAAFIVSILAISSISVVIPNNENIVYAAESKALRDAKAKISHLTKSLKTNYLGLKNQATWEKYIEQSIDLIFMIPDSEWEQREALSLEIDRAIALVNALARINHVEKSIAPKSEGGYGNYLGIKNAETWNKYIRLAERHLEQVDGSVFGKQYDELVGRKNKVSKTIEKIEYDFQVEYDRVVKLYEEAKSTNDIEKAKAALIEAEKLGTCSRSDKLEYDIKKLIKGETDTVNFTDKTLEKLIRHKINKPSGDIYKSDVEGITKLEFRGKNIHSIYGIENITNLKYLDLSDNYIKDISSLSNLSKLEYLNVRFNEVRSIDSLKKLTNLTHIDLYQNEISDIASLENLVNLTELSLGFNNISNISPLKKLVSLEDLYLAANNIKDIGVLENMKNLKYLNISANNIDNIDILGRLNSLIDLNIAYNKISNIRPLHRLIYLERLCLNNNDISNYDLESLEDALVYCSFYTVDPPPIDDEF